MSERVHEVTELLWPFRIGSSNPQLLVGDSRLRVDPFPAYAHDVALVRQALADTEAAWPLDPAPVVYVLAYETESRTNGWASPETVWDVATTDGGPAWQPAPGQIVLNGKRIPPHPATTRYVVAHEYGHHVEYDLLRRRGLATHSDELLEEYAAMRGLAPAFPAYGGGTWHMHPREVFANDFRVLIAGAEVEFWPHPGILRPEQVNGLREWWEAQR